MTRIKAAEKIERTWVYTFKGKIRKGTVIEYVTFKQKPDLVTKVEKVLGNASNVNLLTRVSKNIITAHHGYFEGNRLERRSKVMVVARGEPDYEKYDEMLRRAKL